MDKKNEPSSWTLSAHPPSSSSPSTQKRALRRLRLNISSENCILGKCYLYHRVVLLLLFKKKQFLGPRKSLINVVCDCWVHPFGLPLQTWSPGHFYLQTFWARCIVVA